MNKNLKKYAKATSFFVGLASLVCNFIASGLTVDNVSEFFEKARETSGSLADYWTIFTVFFATAPIVLASLASALLIYHTELKQWVAWATAGIWLIAIFASAAVVHPANLAAANHVGSVTGSPVSTQSPNRGCYFGTAPPHLQVPVGTASPHVSLPIGTQSPLITLPDATESPDITLPIEEPSVRCSLSVASPPPGIPSQFPHSPLGLLLSIFLFEFNWIFTAYGKVLALQGIAVGIIGAGSMLYFPQKWALEEKKAEAEKKKEREKKDGPVNGDESEESQ